MPLIECPDCGKQISDAAPACPSCGRPMVTDRPAPTRRPPRAERPRRPPPRASHEPVIRAMGEDTGLEKWGCRYPAYGLLVLAGLLLLWSFLV